MYRRRRPRRHGGAWPDTGTTRPRRRPHRRRRLPSLSHFTPPQRPRLHRFRRGFTGQRYSQYARRRLSPHATGQALFDLRDGTEPGASFQRQRPAHIGRRARNRQRCRRRADDAPALPAREDFGARRPFVRAGSPHRNAPPPPRSWRPDDAGWRLDAPGPLRRQH